MNLCLICQVLCYLNISLLIPGTMNATIINTHLQSGSDKASSIAAMGEHNIRLLKVGTRIKRGLKGDKIHVYRLTLTAGYYLKAVVEQQGIDVVVTLFGPDGKHVIEVDNSTSLQGPEEVWAIADASGAWHLQVRSLKPSAKPGRYKVKVEELREATGGDKRRVAAEQSLIEGRRLWKEQTAETVRRSIEKYEVFLSYSREVEDKAREASTLNNIGVAYDSLGDKQKALEYFNLALPIRREARNRKGEADTVMNIAGVYNSLGDKQKALEYFNLALPILQEVKDRRGEVTTLSHIGAIYNSLGDRQKALWHCRSDDRY